MNWNVTYRSKDGELVVESFQAESRDALFKTLAAKGISPVRLAAGNDSQRKQRSGRAGGLGHRSASATAKVRRAAIVSASLCAVAVACGLYWFLVLRHGEKASDIGQTPKTKRIPEVQRQPQQPKPTVEVNPTPDEKPLSNREMQLKEIRDKFGDDIPESLKATVYFLEHPPQKVFKVRSNADFLRHKSERMLAGVALVEPGTFFVVKPEFGESFDQDFVNALVDKIEFNDDDSDETRAIKEGVVALKKDIAEICKTEGKKPSEVMNEHATAMYELGRYQRDLEQELDRIHANPEYSDADVEDFCEAANELLKSKGLAPMRHLDLTRRSFRIKSLQRMAERKAAREQAQEENK